jgi:PAS domain S-box-containing protein
LEKKNKVLTILSLVTAVVLFFIADIFLSLGMIIGIAFILILFISSRYLDSGTTYFITALSSVFLFLEPFVSNDYHNNLVLFNRVISILLLWFFAVILLKNRRNQIKLKESEEQYRHIVEASYEGIIFTDANGRINFSNTKIEELLGYSTEELLNKSFFDLLKNSTPPIHSDDETEASLKKKNGELIIAVLTSRSINLSGGIKRIFIIRDLTTDRQKEIELIESQARLSGIVSSAMDAIVSINSEQNIILFNNAAELMFGYSKEEVFGKHIGLLIPDEVRNLHKKYVNNFGNTGTTNRHMGALGAVRGLKKNGKEFPIEASISQVKTSGEKFYTVILRDITERKLAEQNLLESENRFRNMADNAPVLIWVADENGDVNYFNRSWLDFTGRKLSEEQGKKWMENIHPDERDLVYRKFISAFSKKESLIIEFRLKRHDGIYRWILNQVIPRISPGNQFSGYICSSVDITERKIVEEELNTSLKEKEVLIKEVHHRVKNNLQIISSLLNLQSEFIMDEKFNNLIVESQNRIKSMALIHEKLYQTKALSKIDLNIYVTELVNNLLKSYLQDRNSITLKMDIEDIEVDIDSGINLGLIINEIISNSLKYAFPNGFKGEKTISVSFKRDDLTGKIRLCIKDTGVGIPESFNIQETNTLGVQLVDTLTTQLDGTLEYKNENGTKVEIVF